MVALSGPGRIDIVDGQARYLVAKNLVDHGDPAVRDPDIWFSFLPGRDGNWYSAYRFPHSLLGFPAILIADATGPIREVRRQFFFSMIGAALAALLAIVYAVWFRRQGQSPVAAIGWALAGIFCTPTWYYATSTFDDIIGTLLVVAAVVFAWWGRGGLPDGVALASEPDAQRGRSLQQPSPSLRVGLGTYWNSALAGLLLGLALNAKQPLGIFALPLLALTWMSGRLRRINLWAMALLFGGMMIGVGAYLGYEWFKFPGDTRAAHPPFLAKYLPAWPGDTPAALCGLLLSPAAGVFWYCPPLVLALVGTWRWRRVEPRFFWTLALACTVFIVFVCTMSIYKGDPCWGPRYLTPIFALLWLFAPTAARTWPRRLTTLLLGFGLLVQLLGLSVDPHRLYVTLRLPSAFYFEREWVYFHPAIGHLTTRPREIVEILRDDGTLTMEFMPRPMPTSAPPLLEEMENGPEAVRKYRFLASFRPWWISQQWLPPAERPVDLRMTAALLGAMALAGGLLLLGAARVSGNPSTRG